MLTRAGATAATNASAADPNYVLLGSDFDGGTGCMGLTDLSDAFHVLNSSEAQYTQAGIRFTAIWTDDYATVTVYNT